MAPTYAFQGYRLDPESRELTKAGARVPLQPKVFALLLHLVEQRERSVTLDELLAAVWPDVKVGRGSVHRAVSSLRQQLGDDHGLVASASKGSYRFGAEVELEPDSSVHQREDEFFVGRRELLETLEGQLRKAARGRLEFSLLFGPPGIGKSCTASELARRAEAQGAVVLEGRCLEGTGAPAYRPWLQILRAFARREGVGAARRAFGPGLHDLLQALPELARTLDEPAPGPQPANQLGARARFFDAIGEWLMRSARQRLFVLSIDDLHLADSDSLGLLAFLESELIDAQVMILGTARDTRLLESNAEAALDSITRRRPGSCIDVSGLDDGEVEAFLAEHLGRDATPELAARLADRTGGNPLFLQQLVGSGGFTGNTDELERIAEPPSRGLQAAIRRHLEDASPDCVELLRVASAIGRENDRAVLAAALEWPRERVEQAVREAIRLHIFERNRGDELRFVHGLFPELAYSELSEAERVRQHARAYRGLSNCQLSGGAGHADATDAAVFAEHAAYAASEVGALEAARIAARAGEAAYARTAYDEAERLYQLGISVLPAPGSPGDDPECRALRPRALRECARAASAAGRIAEARPLYERAGDLAAELGDWPLLAEATLGPTLADETGHFDAQLVQRLRAAIEGAPPEAHPLTVQLLGALSKSLYFRDRDECIAAGERATHMARDLGEPVALGHALSKLHFAYSWSDLSDSRCRVSDEAVELARGVDDAQLHAAVLRSSVCDAVETADRPLTLDRLGESERVARRGRLSLYTWYTELQRAMLALLEGRCDEAESLMNIAYQRGRRIQPASALQMRGVQQLLFALDFGDPAPLRFPLESLTREYPEMAPWRAALALIDAEVGDFTSAQQRLAVECGQLDELRRDINFATTLAALAIVAQRVADPVCAGEIEKALGEVGHRYVCIGIAAATQGAVARYRGLCRELLGDPERALAYYDEALAIERAMSSLPYEAHTLADRARVLRNLERNDEARRDAADALAMAARLGMERLHMRVSGAASQADLAAG